MIATTLPSTTPLSADTIAELAVHALRAEAELTPKPGLVDRRGSGAHTDMNVTMLLASAEALRTTFAECALAASQLDVGAELRERVGVIGRAGEAAMLAATGGVNTHRGALWALGLLGAGAATGTGIEHAVNVAARLAGIADAASHRASASSLSHGARVQRRYGATGAVGEAQSGFPHVMQRALPALRADRSNGTDESTARLDALLALMAHLDDTCVLHRGGAAGLRAVQTGAGGVLAAGGYRTHEGQQRFSDLAQMCTERRLSPGGSGDLLSAALFLDTLHEMTGTPCKP